MLLAKGWPKPKSRGILRGVTRLHMLPLLLVALCSACPSSDSKPAPEVHAPTAKTTEAPVLAVDPAPAVVAPAPPSTPAPTPRPAAIDPAQVGFFGASEIETLARLRDADFVAVKKGSGGRSLGFKLTFADGKKGYFKVEQSFSGANWYAEVAAHYLDRALGLGRVAPVVSREIDWNRLVRAAGSDERIQEVVVRDGRVRGAVVAWVDGDLTPLVSPLGWENWVRVEPWNAYNPSPFQRAREYYAALNQPRSTPAYETIPEPDRADRAAELSDLLVFDFLTLNIDRWGGDNTNVLTIGKAGPLVFLDNGAAFAHGPPLIRLMQDRLAPLQKFRKSTIDALRALDLEQLAARMATDPLAPILTDDDLEGLAIRRIAVLDRVAELQALHGDKIFAW